MIGRRYLMIWLVMVLIMAGLSLPTATSTPTTYAQTSPEDEINALARAVHLQNLRTFSITQWVGGDLGMMSAWRMNVEAGTQFTDWRLRDMYDDNTFVTLEDLDRPVLMNMWASWCGPCKFEFPFLTDIALNETTNYDLWFVNTSDTNESAARRFLRTQAEGITNYYDVNNAFNRQIGRTGLPTTLLIDTDGTLLAAHSGVVTPTVMRFFNAVAGNPHVGSLDIRTIEAGELRANIRPVDVATAQPIVYGQQVAGGITDDAWQHNYSFEGKANEKITITMTSTEQDFDSYVVLLDADGNRLAENDNGPVPPNAYLEYTLPADGTYIVVATRFLEEEGFSAGGFTLTVSQGDTATDPTDNTNTLTPNIPSSGRLSRDRTQDVYTLTATEGQVITFTLTHDQPAADDYLNFQVRIGATERVVPFTETVDGALTVEVTMPQTETYSVYVSRPMRSRSGPITYTLTVETDAPVEDASATDDTPPAEDTTETDDSSDTTANADNPPTDDPQQDGDTAILTYGDTVSDSLTPTIDSISYTFYGEAGDIVTLEMVALNPTLDPMLYLFGPTGAVFAANDDNGRNTDARIPAYELPMTGDYVILATRFTTTRVSGGAGEFQLTLTQVLDVPSVVDDAGNDTTDTPPNNTTSPPVVVDATAIANGETVNQSLDNSRYEVRYSFDGAMGDVITVDMIARDGDLDPYLALYTAENKLVAFNDDDTSNASRNARLQTIELPLDGTYIIVASRYGGLNGTTQGAFDLSFAINGQTTPDASGSNLNPARDLLDASAVPLYSVLEAMGLPSGSISTKPASTSPSSRFRLTVITMPTSP